MKQITHHLSLFFTIIALLLCANNRIAAQQPSFYYTVDCSNNITWTIENNSQYTSSVIVDSTGANIINNTTPPLEGAHITLICSNAVGFVSTSQYFTLRACLMPSFVYYFSNNGANINVATTTDSLQSDLSYTLNGVAQGVGHTNATPNFVYNDVFGSNSSTDIICVKAIYKNLGGNSKNTACRERCVSITPQNCAQLAAAIIGQNLDPTNGQPTVLQATAAFSAAPTSATYTYQWSTGNTSTTLNINPNTMAAYTVTVTSDRGCVATARQYLPVWQIKDTVACLVDSFTRRRSGAPE